MSIVMIDCQPLPIGIIFISNNLQANVRLQSSSLLGTMFDNIQLNSNNALTESIYNFKVDL